MNSQREMPGGSAGHMALSSFPAASQLLQTGFISGTADPPGKLLKGPALHSGSRFACFLNKQGPDIGFFLILENTKIKQKRQI